MRREIIEKLQQEILSMQGLGVPTGQAPLKLGLGPLEAALPNRCFPTSAVHEFITPTTLQAAAATTGFLSAIAGHLMQQSEKPCLWVCQHRKIYPPALKLFGIAPEKIIFTEARGTRDLLWTIEEALKCQALTAVIGQVSELGFTESRRLQLAVEQSQVTALIHRFQPRAINTTACVARWEVRPLATALSANTPGVGHPRWRVSLQKIRNGKPGAWDIEWSEVGFRLFTSAMIEPTVALQNVG